MTKTHLITISSAHRLCALIIMFCVILSGECLAYVWDHQAAVNYANTWFNQRNTTRYYDYSSSGGDCANFASQCLIAGGLDLSAASGRDSYGCIPSCDNLNNFLLSCPALTQSQVEPRTTGVSNEPLWFLPGDIGIFGTAADSWVHAVICVFGDATHYAKCASHTPDTDITTIPGFFTANPTWAQCTYYEIGGGVDHTEPASTHFTTGDSLTVSAAAVNMRNGPCYGETKVNGSETAPALLHQGDVVQVLSDPQNGKSYNGYYWWKMQFGTYQGWCVGGDTAGNWWFTKSATDTTSPTISVFNVSPPSTVTLGQGFTISYTVSDSGGSHLKQVELWRANVDGTVNDPSWAQIGSTIPLSGDGPSSGSFPTDIPPTAGNYWYGIHVIDNANNYMDERIAGRGPLQRTVVSPTRIISLSGNLAFGNVTVGSSPQSSLTIYNTGNSTMTISSISYPSGFSGNWSGTIAAGGSQSVTVTFSPTSAISYGGTVTVNSDKTSGTNTITASGTGIPVPTRIISLSGNLAFGNVTVGSSPQSSFTIYNTGNSTMTISSINYPSGFSGNWSGTIAANGSQSVTVTFSPTSAISYGGTVTVNSDATSGTNTISASGTGVPVPTRIISLSGNLAFGNVTVGSSPQSSLTIYNTGNSTLTVSGISYPSGFSGNWTGTIGAGGSQSVAVTFSPTSAISYGGTVTVNSDKTSGTNTITASGTGTLPNTEPVLCPMTVDLNNDGLPDFYDFSYFAMFWQNTSCSPPNWCEGRDFDHNGVVDINDLQIFAEFWLWPVADVDIDGDVDFIDYAVFVNHWMEQDCTAPNWCEGTDFDHSGSVDIFDLATFVRYWLEEN